ncbi:hypothetical protein EIM44_04260 [Bibersteinia trehalosi]|uniref:Uncharacterized protein n=1 Tax=Bibersteinia trehalosi TaxID=47735 RepID=A0A426FJB0_BIBTR|nr:hypothetical protein [Bibersteinia trehalosi]RRN04661.1 hypothetical protein EIM44_04260 [Bibersteinia trehalosi]
MFIAVNSKQEGQIVLNTDKICSIEYQSGKITVLFDNQIEIEICIESSKEYLDLVRHLAIANNR